MEQNTVHTIVNTVRLYGECPVVTRKSDGRPWRVTAAIYHNGTLAWLCVERVEGGGLKQGQFYPDSVVDLAGIPLTVEVL